MKHKISTLVFLIIFTPPVTADGPPVDENGNILVDHLVFYFDSLQIKQIQYGGFFDLNDDQMKVLQKINFRFERKIHFISPFYNDCTCGMTYAIWNKEKSFAVPLYNILNEIDDSKGIPNDEIEEMEVYAEESSWNNEQNSGALIFIGTNGDIYYNKKVVSIDDIKILIEGISEKDENIFKFIMVRKPPKINREIDKYINVIIEELDAIAEKFSINFQITG